MCGLFGPFGVASAMPVMFSEPASTMTMLVPPHGGGPLKSRLVPVTERGEEFKRAQKLTKVPLTSREVSDLLMLAMGAYTPLDGFMGEEDWRRCCVDMQTSAGL